MSRDDHDTGRARPRESREDRLAAALRANLRRRKAQDRARRASGEREPSAASDPGTTDHES